MAGKTCRSAEMPQLLWHLPILYGQMSKGSMIKIVTHAPTLASYELLSQLLEHCRLLHPPISKAAATVSNAATAAQLTAWARNLL